MRGNSSHKTRYTIYPYLASDGEKRDNPYIRDCICSLRQYGEVVNKPSRNPLLSILSPVKWGDVCIFNWYESIPDYKYGLLQSAAAIVLLLLLKCSRKRIVWVLHNRLPHSSGRMWLKKFMMAHIARLSSLIVTHATDGLGIIRDKYPFAVGKAHYMDHPTKNRLSLVCNCPKEYDLLIWGRISQYKGVVEFVDYVKDSRLRNLRICIAGECSSSIICDRLNRNLPDNICWINKSLSFEELGECVSKSRFVLAPYASETVLSSGVLMDSLSYGAKVIGPAVGSFKDYSLNKALNVYLFHTFDDIDAVVESQKNTEVSAESYAGFLDNHDWNHWAQQLSRLLEHK